MLNAAPATWHDAIHSALSANGVRLATYVPDTVLNPLMDNLLADESITTFVATREEEAIGIATGAWMGGLVPVVLMQTSGFATLANVLASLIVPYQIPLVMIISERGTLGEFNQVQVLPGRAMRPVLDSLAIEHHTITQLDQAAFTVDRSIRQAVSTQSPVALIVSPLLTGGKTEKGKAQ